MSVSLLNSRRPFFFVAVGITLLLHLLIAWGEARFPSTDVFLFKEAGMNLALHGKFVVSNLPHMAADQSALFSYYPPVYPFLYGVWAKVFGTGLSSAILFDNGWRLLRTLALLLLFSGGTTLYSRASIVFLCLSTFFTGDADRPDDMAMFFGLMSWWALRIRNHLRFFSRDIFAGILLGLCAATSPTAGVFFTLGTLFLKRNIFSAILPVGIAIATFFLGNAPVFLADPLAYQRFQRQVPMSAFPYLKKFQEAGLSAGIAEWAGAMPLWWSVAGPLVIAFVGLLFVIAFYRKNLSVEARQKSSVFLWTPVLFLPLSLAVWNLQPFYLWFGCVALLGGAIIALEDRTIWKDRNTALIATLGLVLSPMIVREAKFLFNAWERPREESSALIRDKVLAEVGNRRLAVTPDQYFTFRPVREVANIRYVCDRLDSYDFVYSTRYMSAQRAASDPFYFPCDPKRECFTPKTDFSSKKIFTFLGQPTPYFVRGNGGMLFENTKCRPTTQPQVTALLPKGMR